MNHARHPRGNTQLIILALLLVVGGGVFWAWRHSKASALTRQIQGGQVKLVLYGTPDERFTAVVVEDLKLRRLPYEFVNSDQQDRVVELAHRSGHDTLSFPLLAVGDRVFWGEDLDAVLAPVPAVAFARLKSEPYIMVYGPTDCPRTEGMINELKARKLDYEFRDINQVAAGAEIISRLKARGFRGQKLDFPLMDVNGHLAGAPKLAQVEAWYAER